MAKKEFRNIKIEIDDYQFIKDLATEESLSILATVSRMVELYRSHHLSSSESSSENSKEKESDLKLDSVPLKDDNENFQLLVTAIKRMLVKENNRILGIYFNTDKMVKDMYRDMHFLLNSVEYQKGKMEHPFIADLKIQTWILRQTFEHKYKVISDAELEVVMRSVLPASHVKEYFSSLARTNSGLVSYMKY